MNNLDRSRSAASGLGEVILLNEKWQLWTKPGKNPALLFDRQLEDLAMWWGFEMSDTLIGSEVARQEVKLSPQGLDGLRFFRGLYPEWGSKPYMGMSPKQRRRRLNTLFGDNPLAIEPSREEILPHIYQCLIEQILLGGPAAIGGAGSVDLVLIKVPRWLPAEHRNKLVSDYLDLIYQSQERTSRLRLSGKSGPFHRLKRELQLLGFYRLFKANKFNLERTKQAAHYDLRSSGRAFYTARKFIERLIPKRWELFEPHLCLIRGSPLIGQ